MKQSEPMLRIKRIDLSGYKSIQHAEIDLDAMNVLIGPNGAGKSNLLSFFRLLNYALSGSLQHFVQKQGGASKLLHYGPKRTTEISARIDFQTDAGIHSYLVQWGHAAGDRLVFLKEEIIFHRNDQPIPEQYSLGAGHQESALLDSSENPTAKFVIKGALERLRVYHFHDTSAEAHIKQKCRVDDNRYLRHDGGNLAAYLYMLQQRHPQAYMKIRRTVQNVAPFFHDFWLQPAQLNQSTMALAWQERGSDFYFDASDLSDGTLRFMCLATLLLQPSLPRAIIIDEPELGLHPAAIHLLVGLLRSASVDVQLILSTQSVTLVDEIERPQDIVVVERGPGDHSHTRYHRLSETDLAEWLRDYSLGQLWLKNVVGGRP